jgi:hypothetical protein
VWSVISPLAIPSVISNLLALLFILCAYIGEYDDIILLKSKSIKTITVASITFGFKRSNIRKLDNVKYLTILGEIGFVKAFFLIVG